MRIQSITTGLNTSQSATEISDRHPFPDLINPMIGEYVIHDNKLKKNHLLLPSLLQQLGKQSRWLLWLTHQQKLNRCWMQQANLPINKMLQLKCVRPISTLENMKLALSTGNYSVVIGWLPDISEQERLTLRFAAQQGKACGLVILSRQHPYFYQSINIDTGTNPPQYH